MDKRLRAGALGLLAAALVACGGSSSGGGEPGSSTTPTESGSTPAAAGTAPANPTAAKAEIIKNWKTFLDSNTSSAEAKALLENGDDLDAALAKAQEENEATGGERSARVTKVTFVSPAKANVVYLLHAAGQTLHSAGDSVLQDGVWKVSETTFCSLVELGNGGKPVRGCSR
jgi:hypothetical protein